MSIRTVSRLTQTLINDPNYFNRKGVFTLNFFFDVELAQAIAIPINQEHIQVMQEYLHVDLDDIRNDPRIGSHLVPVTFIFQPSTEPGYPWRIHEIVIGVCGAEIAFKVRHHKEELNRAEELLKTFIKDADYEGILYDTKTQIGIIRKYQIK